MSESEGTLFARLRSAFESLDPAPADLADRMVAAMAVADLSREYALLTLIEDAPAAVRGDADTTTLQFSDGNASILLHISRAENGARRVDGWVDAAAVQVRLTQGTHTRAAVSDDQGRFAFDDVPPGLSRVLLISADDGKDLLTPQFEV